MAMSTSNYLRGPTSNFLLGFTYFDHTSTGANERDMPSNICPYIRIGIENVGTYSHTGRPYTLHLRGPRCQVSSVYHEHVVEESCLWVD